ncbi:5-dehydro-2-deoxygluconokinase [Porticoccus sp. W117]|uniref:bifunctional 5-dehydro-2-deoxygluconokinase/5-dehydro-2- deoxyphosphogluconate aldolase n=1 Tax=Porticoccus sp. W117 TaxID=3054777 RepID=UPI00259883F9|nr:5-dehydro-2-deoxygluconokinase [Porticoccus sp. W117]MDM3870088.1 5-dehydro-2-deoxygluconokinase [Porticoccus sp. W117]
MTTANFDVICMGRAAVDLYSQQIGESLEDCRSFNKYLGGSSGNIAIGVSRLGLKTAMLTRVGDEQMGRFVTSELRRNGVNTDHISLDPTRLTGLVLLGIQDTESFPLLFYRDNCADMALEERDIDESFIASSRALVITGTHFSTLETFQASKLALAYAEKHQVKRVLDIDYRPVLWGLTAKGDGETRYISAESVTEHLQSVIPHFDLIVGTEEEIHIAAGNENTLQAVKKIRELNPSATIVVKRGSLGCVVFDQQNIPEELDGGIVSQGRKVDVLNVLGAGDAFISGFLRGWIRNDSINKCCEYANACGAIVVSRHGCSPAMPTETELNYFLSEHQAPIDPASDVMLNHLHRVTTRQDKHRSVYALAFDHRKQLLDMADEAGACPSKLFTLKSLIAKAAVKVSQEENLEGSAGILVDDTYGQRELFSTRESNLWVGRPVELPGSRPIAFEGGEDITSTLSKWPKHHVVKCLVFYHPDDSVSMRETQHKRIKSLYRACVRQELELLLEIIPPKESKVSDDTIARCIENFYQEGIYPDWWKLPAQTTEGWKQTNNVIESHDRWCRGILILGLEAPMNVLQESFLNSVQAPLCKGFAIGRSVFSEPSKLWLRGEMNDTQLVDQVAENYREIVHMWKQRENQISQSENNHAHR